MKRSPRFDIERALSLMYSPFPFACKGDDLFQASAKIINFRAQTEKKGPCEIFELPMHRRSVKEHLNDETEQKTTRSQFQISVTEADSWDEIHLMYLQLISYSKSTLRSLRRDTHESVLVLSRKKYNRPTVCQLGHGSHVEKSVVMSLSRMNSNFDDRAKQ